MHFLKRFFSPTVTEPETPPPEIVSTPVEPRTGCITRLPPGIHVGKLTEAGRVRERNEDSLYTLESVIQYEHGREPFGLFIVADGMGGHQKGELASLTATRVTANYILKNVYLPYLSNHDQHTSPQPINEVLIEAIESANLQVQKVAPEGGTTLTVALVMGNNAYIAHVGDTRAYFFNQNRLQQITQDHSLAQRLKDTGQVTAEEAAQVEHILYRAVGQGASIQADIHLQHLPPGSSLLLCSDGLWKGINNDDLLKEIIASSNTPQEACQHLVAEANNNGDDNITVIIISMGLEEASD
uniref:Protein phosphatase 2C n=1 Tax=uncultured Chloroflexota bacterium TaxID=166587 RepID=H5SPE2_9CHLR|nr:protein phosphatase 2C [uncultured Chloroflexota bacterium]